MVGRLHLRGAPEHVEDPRATHSAGMGWEFSDCGRRLGTPRAIRLDKDAEAYVRTFPKRKGAGLRPKVRAADGGAIFLLERLLRLNFRERIHVCQALRDRSFDGIRETFQGNGSPSTRRGASLTWMSCETAFAR